MSVPVIVLTNGRRDCISQAIASARKHLLGIGSITIVNDSPDFAYGRWLDDTFIGQPYGCGVLHKAGNYGYWQAMQVVWNMARHQLSYFGADSVFFLEDDFIFHEDIAVEPMRRVLNVYPYLTQMALLRQPWFENERIAGGLIEALEQQGQKFLERKAGVYSWVEHRACFTGNPSLIPARTFEHDWPEGSWSESQFGRLLFSDPRARGAYWGRRSDPPRVEHIGHERVGTDY